MFFFIISQFRHYSVSTNNNEFLHDNHKGFSTLFLSQDVSLPSLHKSNNSRHRGHADHPLASGLLSVRSPCQPVPPPHRYTYTWTIKQQIANLLRYLLPSQMKRSRCSSADKKKFNKSLALTKTKYCFFFFQETKNKKCGCCIATLPLVVCARAQSAQPIGSQHHGTSAVSKHYDAGQSTHPDPYVLCITRYISMTFDGYISFYLQGWVLIIL